ncbi:MAG: hypothetical protein ACFCVD_00115 [Nodosilinea sp.]
MTDIMASHPAPDSDSKTFSSEGGEALDQGVADPTATWETVDFPGQITIEDDPGLGSTAGPLAAVNVDQDGPSIPSQASQNNTNELIQLIQDLNQCNDALLGRVSELEEDLERSQVALQAEVERNQTQGSVAAGVNASQTMPMPPQIAQLLSELEIANDGLRRTTIHNETLQAELDASQQRVAQLERECTLLQQRFSEKTTALHQAEDTCRDLKSRLHRQQRYTLQFKVALEKCLNMAGTPSSGGGGLGVETSGLNLTGINPALGASESSPNAAIGPVSMPKSQQIQPWSASQEAPGSNPSLNHLLRSLKAAGQGLPLPATVPESMPESGSGSESLNDQGLRAVESPGAFAPPTVFPSPQAAATLDRVPDPEVEALLWQDLERVSEPDVNLPTAQGNTADSDPWLDEMPGTHDQNDPMSSPWSGPGAAPAQAAPGFTEPSPWGTPLPVAEPQPSAPPPSPRVTASSPLPPMPQPAMPVQAQPPRVAGTAALPDYLQTNAQVSPSPVVYPLRAQKKIKSLAAVQLPTFGRSPRR